MTNVSLAGHKAAAGLLKVWRQKLRAKKRMMFEDFQVAPSNIHIEVMSGNT